MDRPTTVDDAARVLVDLANVDGLDNPTAPDDGVVRAPWEALTRPRVGRELAHEVELGRRRQAAREGINLSLPPIVVRLPFDYLARTGWATMLGTPNGEALAADGYSDWRTSVATTPANARHRPRLAIVGEPESVPVSPRGSRAVVLGVLVAERAAEQLDAWRLPDRRATRRARTEAHAYRELAEQYRPLIAGSFAWLDDLDPAPTTAPAFPTVPVTLRGTAQLGLT